MVVGLPTSKTKSTSFSNRESEPVIVENRTRKKLKQSLYSELRLLRCQCQDGVLVLRGRVSSYYLKQIALATAQKAARGKDIDNMVQVVKRKD